MMLDDNKPQEIIVCKGCGRPLPDMLLQYRLNNPEPFEWYREGYCSSFCFRENHKIMIEVTNSQSLSNQYHQLPLQNLWKTQF